MSQSPTVRLAAVPTSSKTESAVQRRFARLEEERQSIEYQEAKASGNVGFVAKWLVHATLPYKEPKNAPPAWGRSSGNTSLLIQPGYYHKTVETKDARGKTKVQKVLTSYGYPYGTYPRLILAWIATEVIQKRERTLTLGPSLSDFMENIGRTSGTGGARGTITILKNQMQRLFSANIAVTNDPNAIVWQNDGFRIADKSNFEFFWDPSDPGQHSLWASEIKLTERFYDSLIDNPVPVDLRIVKALSRSPLSMDIYCWLTYRNACISRETKISWEYLMQQFGTESSRWKFKENFLRALKDVLVLYSGAKVNYDSQGLLLIPSPPSIPKLVKK